MTDWSALPSDLVRRVGDCFLTASEVDYYMDMRAVCHNWRLAMADPSQHGTDLRFRPRHWVLLDEENMASDDEDDVRLFLNRCIARFVRRRIPLLRDHVLVAVSDGLLVLADSKYPHPVRVLNPLTGSLLRFAATIRRVNRVRAAAASSDLVFSFYHDSYGDMVSWAHPAAGELSLVQFPHRAGPFFCSKQASMASYKGHVYFADQDGTIVRCVTESVRRCHAELIISKSPNATAASPSSSEDTTGRCYGREFLVVSAEELLFVCHRRRRRRRTVEIFRVDVDRKVLDPMKSIGRRSLFLGSRCLSVDHADRLPSIRSNCVYRVTGNGDGVWEYDLGRGGSEKMISTCHSARPFSMVQVLMNYCVALPDVKAQLHSIYRTSD